MKPLTGRNTTQYTVRRLFSIQITIIYHQFTVVSLHHDNVAEMWNIHIKFYYIIKGGIHNYIIFVISIFAYLVYCFSYKYLETI